MIKRYDDALSWYPSRALQINIFDLQSLRSSISASSNFVWYVARIWIKIDIFSFRTTCRLVDLEDIKCRRYDVRKLKNTCFRIHIQFFFQFTILRWILNSSHWTSLQDVFCNHKFFFNTITMIFLVSLSLFFSLSPTHFLTHFAHSLALTLSLSFFSFSLSLFLLFFFFPLSDLHHYFTNHFFYVEVVSDTPYHLPLFHIQYRAPYLRSSCYLMIRTILNILFFSYSSSLILNQSRFPLRQDDSS